MTTHDESLPVNFARAMPNWQPLVEYRRNGVAENTIHGAVSWVSGRNLIYSLDRKSTRLNSSHTVISYAVFCLKKKKLNYLTLEVTSTSYEATRQVSRPQS